MHYAGHEVRVHILDISATGARLHGPIVPGAKEAIDLVWQGISMPGRVAWAMESRFGILFDRPLPGEQIEAMLGS